MDVKSFHITVDKSPAVYAPGETITGKIFVSLDGTKLCRGLNLEIEGKGRVYWNHYVNYYSAKEEHYLRREFSAVGNSYGEVDLAAGQHIFPFAFPLPANIPNSFNHAYGQIEYNIKAVLDLAWTMKNYAHLQFRIYSPLDLSQVPSMPIIDEVRQEYNCCLTPCINNGYMEVQIRSPNRTLEIGEQLDVFIDVEMTSESAEVIAIVVQLKQTLEFHAEDSNRSCSKIVQLVEKRGPFRGNTSVKLGFKVPRVDHSGLQHCSIIRIMYHLGIRVINPDCYRNIEKEYDIRIGSKSTATAQHSDRVNSPLAQLPTSSVSSADAAAIKPRPHSSPNDPLPASGFVIASPSAPTYATESPPPYELVMAQEDKK